MAIPSIQKNKNKSIAYFSVVYIGPFSFFLASKFIKTQAQIKHSDQTLSFACFKYFFTIHSICRRLLHFIYSYAFYIQYSTLLHCSTFFSTYRSYIYKQTYRRICIYKVVYIFCNTLKCVDSVFLYSIFFIYKITRIFVLR